MNILLILWRVKQKLSRNSSIIKCNVDHLIDDAWSIGNVSYPRMKPLKNNKKYHVPENSIHKDEHRYKLSKEIKKLEVLEIINSSEYNAQSHFRNANDDSHLHFQRVNKLEFIMTDTPDRI